MAKKTVHQKIVRSYFAEPDRPKGRDGVRQPIEPEPHSFPPAILPSDDEIAAAVRTALDADGRVPEGQIHVVVRRAIVELTGEVDLEFQRTLAAALAESVPSVLAVTNELAVRQ
jgi:osmotically-inducible protein OsmY